MLLVLVNPRKLSAEVKRFKFVSISQSYGGKSGSWLMYSSSDWTVSVGGYKAVAGSLHEVPGLVNDVAVCV